MSYFWNWSIVLRLWCCKLKIYLFSRVFLKYQTHLTNVPPLTTIWLMIWNQFYIALLFVLILSHCIIGNLFHSTSIISLNLNVNWIYLEDHLGCHCPKHTDQHPAKSPWILGMDRRRNPWILWFYTFDLTKIYFKRFQNSCRLG